MNTSSSPKSSPDDSVLLDCFTPLVREAERAAAGLPPEEPDELEREFRERVRQQRMREAEASQPSQPSPSGSSATK